MRIKDIFKLREVAGERVVVSQSASRTDMTRIISLNDSAGYLWETFYGKDFTLAEVAAELAEKYGIGPERAQKDAAAWVDALKNCHII